LKKMHLFSCLMLLLVSCQAGSLQPISTPTFMFDVDEPNYEFTPRYSPANFENELEKNRAKWESLHITHYQMSVDLPYSSEGYDPMLMPLIVEVKDGNVVSVTNTQGEKVSSDDDIYYDHYFFSVPGLFSYVSETYLEKPPSIEVSYDPTFGYPNTIYIDPWMEPCCQDFTISVQDFQVLSQ
jgi:hypothetical protein